MCILEPNYNSTVILTGTCGLNNRRVLEARPFRPAVKTGRSGAARNRPFKFWFESFDLREATFDASPELQLVPAD